MLEPPVTVTVDDGRLRIAAPTGFNRTSLLGAVDIPIAHVSSVEIVDEPGRAVTGWREGIGLPHLRMGTWRHDGVKDYVAIRTDLPGVVITLHDEAYARMIISVTDPSGMAAALAPGD